MLLVKNANVSEKNKDLVPLPAQRLSEYWVSMWIGMSLRMLIYSLLFSLDLLHFEMVFMCVEMSKEICLVLSSAWKGLGLTSKPTTVAKRLIDPFIAF